MIAPNWREHDQHGASGSLAPSRRFWLGRDGGALVERHRA